jgi:hypothetical protein
MAALGDALPPGMENPETEAQTELRATMYTALVGRRFQKTDIRV